MPLRNKDFSLPLVLTASALCIGGCGAQENTVPDRWQWQQCVDAQGNVVPDSECERERAAGGTGIGPAWWYLYGGRPLALGSNVRNAAPGTAMRAPFSNAPAQRASAFTSTHPAHPSYTAAQRGFFGSTGQNHSVYS